MSHPETRGSLLAKLRDHGDTDAWEEFVRLYRPVIIRVAQAKGMQNADAEDLAQKVLVAVAGAIDRFDDQKPNAKFRTWLRRIADNAIINSVTRGKHHDHQPMIDWQSEPAQRDQENSALIQTEYRRELFLVTANEVRGEFSDHVWTAFWQTAVEGAEIPAVARQTGKTIGSVYAARARVMKRLREKIQTRMAEDE